MTKKKIAKRKSNKKRTLKQRTTRDLVAGIDLRTPSDILIRISREDADLLEKVMCLDASIPDAFEDWWGPKHGDVETVRHLCERTRKALQRALGTVFISSEDVPTWTPPLRGK
jgi:hypothetical protein